MEAIAQEAGTIVFNIIKKKVNYQSKVFPGEVVVGKSTKQVDISE